MFSDNVKEVLLSRYFMSNLNYCPLIWMSSSAKSLNIIENFQQRALRFLLDNQRSTLEQLVNKASRSSMSINRLRTLCAKIYKTLKVESCKLSNNKYMIASTQIRNTEIFAPIADLLFKQLSHKVLFISTGDYGNC